MRIALMAPLVTPIQEPQLGGSQALLADLAIGLTGRGHDVSVFAASDSHIDGVDVVDTGVDASGLAASMYRAEGGADTAAAETAFATAYGQVSEGSFDIVHGHAFDVAAIEHGARLERYVHTLHLPPQDDIVAALGRVNIVVACVSVAHADAWSTMTHIDTVLRNGIPTSRIPWSPDGGERALFAGRFSPEKGAAEAIAIALGAGMPLTLVGSPYDRAYFDREISPHAGEVEIRDAMPRADLWAVMGSSLAVLCPVQWDEPFGLVAAEAQATGTPVIAFRRGGLAQVVVDDLTGALVADVDEAAQALRDAGRFDRATCRSHAERDLDLEATLDAHEELYGRMRS